MTDAAAVFVHGLFSSSRTWEPILRRLRSDPQLRDLVECRTFPYPSPRWKLRPDRRIPDFETISASLATFLDVECASQASLVLVGHSQGGLIIQRYLQRMLAEGRGRDLARVRKIILLACPNNGSEFMLSVRKATRFWAHPQERDLRPLADSVADTLRRVMNNVVFASKISDDHCPIPFAVYAGESDGVVTRGSANSVFPSVGVLPGDHHSILSVEGNDNRTFNTLKYDLLGALAGSAPRYALTRRLAEGLATPSIDLREPVLRVTTRTITRGEEVTSQAIEIFDSDTANLWIRHNHTLDATATGRRGEDVG